MKTYGKELILDLHDCDPDLFNRDKIETYFKELCDLIEMHRCELFWWDDHGLPPEECQTEPHLKGTSAVQFIMTSNITLHSLDILKTLHINVFSCKDFDSELTTNFTKNYFKGEVVQAITIDRI